ncbi:MAG: helix-turn-helix transcriptional regulator [Halomonas sp.]|nr:helix-turn-helix transcriptional regulator [Halomonas sp.]MCC5881902.1 helix-turn-helix transcriptional regulator [Halomonas sp.]
MAKNLVEYILENTDLKQKDIAERLGVSRGQVSKWKAGEYISDVKSEQLRELAGVFGDDIEWVEVVKTKKNAQAWLQFAYEADSEWNSLGGSDDEWASLTVRSILLELKESGIDIPPHPPRLDEEGEPIDNTEFVSFFYNFMENYGVLNEWMRIHFSDDDESDLFEQMMELENFLPALALRHSENDVLAGIGADLDRVMAHCRAREIEARKIIRDYCTTRTRKNLPLIHNYFALIEDHPYGLDDEVYASILPTMEDQLPYADRQTIAFLSEQNDMLYALHRKLDLLLSEEQKTILRKMNDTEEKYNHYLNIPEDSETHEDR